MPFSIASMIPRARRRIDPVIFNQFEEIPQDGQTYVQRLANTPILSGTDEAFLQHNTFTTGIPQKVYESSAMPLATSGIHYDMNYARGTMDWYNGYATGNRTRFAPWNTSTLTIYYNSSTYTDDVVAQYLTYSVPQVEAQLQLGMYVSGISGIAPATRNQADIVRQLTTTENANAQTGPYQYTEKYVITDDVEVVQELISMRAALDILGRERKVGGGDAIKIVDGDTQIDTSVNQRHVRDYVRDQQKEYDSLIKDVIHKMLDGFNIEQINDQSYAYSNNFATDWDNF